jgi:hypothetical protein
MPSPGRSSARSWISLSRSMPRAHRCGSCHRLTEAGLRGRRVYPLADDTGSCRQACRSVRARITARICSCDGLWPPGCASRRCAASCVASVSSSSAVNSIPQPLQLVVTVMPKVYLMWDASQCSWCLAFHLSRRPDAPSSSQGRVRAAEGSGATVKSPSRPQPGNLVSVVHGASASARRRSGHRRSGLAPRWRAGEAPRANATDRRSRY